MPMSLTCSESELKSNLAYQGSAFFEYLILFFNAAL